MYVDIVLCLDSTRKLYEKKLAEAMAKNNKPSSDKTYYREERNSLIVINPPVSIERTYCSFGNLL